MSALGDLDRAFCLPGVVKRLIGSDLRLKVVKKPWVVQGRQRKVVLSKLTLSEEGGEYEDRA